MFGIGTTEMVIFGLVLLLLFGSRLPKAMRSLGRSVVSFKEGLNDKSESTREIEEGA
jgi:sec-independent protein translocase protein TatA